jgi:hypothetical protein
MSRAALRGNNGTLVDIPRRRRRRRRHCLSRGRSPPGAEISADPTSMVGSCDAAPQRFRCHIWRRTTSRCSAKCGTEPSECLFKVSVFYFMLYIDCFDCSVVIFLVEKTIKIHVMNCVFGLFSSTIIQVCRQASKQVGSK